MGIKGFNKIALYIIFIMIIMLCPHVYALEVDVTNIITSPETSGQGKYRGTEILNTGGQFTYNVKTRYQGKLSRIIYNLPLPSELGDCYTTNATYTITMYMETNDWNNKFGTVKVRPYSSSSTNWSSGTVTYVSYKKIYFTFKIPSSDTTCYDFVWVDLPSTNLSNTGITQISNWNLNKVTLTDPTITSGGSGGGVVSPTPTANTTQQIIDNQNDNTQNIIDNQNENTQNIIENNNTNTQNIIDSNLVCKSYSLNDSGTLFDGYLGATGTFYSQTGNYNKTTDFIPVNPDTRFFLEKSSTTNKRLCFYDVFKTNTGCYTTNEYSAGQEFTIPSGSAYFRINFEVSENSPIIKVCSNGNQAIVDTLNNDSVDSGVGSNFFNDFDSDDNGGISAIVTKPLVIVNSLLSNNSSCANLSLPEFMGVSNAYLPSGCILWNNAPSSVISVWNIIVCGLGSYFILRDLFKLIENLKNPDNDKVEVMDL